MITFVFILMLLSYGLGYFTNLVVENIKAIDEIVERNKREEEEQKQKNKNTVDDVIVDIVKPIKPSSELNKLKQNINGVKK
jgi:transcriptional regulator with GAF, ATPase, and Fis domain